MRFKKVLSLLIILCILISMLPVSVWAAPAMSIYKSNGDLVDDGGSIHYTGSSATFTVYFSPSPFNLYCSNGFSQWTNSSSMPVTLNNPSGPITITGEDDEGNQVSKIINFYKDTVVDPGASLSYVSVKAKIKKVNGQPISEFIVDYDGYTNTGVNRRQVAAKFGDLGMASGTYTLEGELQIAVFVNGVNDGVYWVKGDEELLFSRYSWGSVAEELMQRQNWAATEYIEPEVLGSFIVRYKDINTGADIATAVIKNNIPLPKEVTADLVSVPEEYNQTPLKYIWGYGDGSSAASQTKQDYSSPIKVYLSTANKDGYAEYYFDKKIKGIVNITYKKTDGTVLATETKEVDINGTTNVTISRDTSKTFAGYKYKEGRWQYPSGAWTSISDSSVTIPLDNTKTVANTEWIFEQATDPYVTAVATTYPSAVEFNNADMPVIVTVTGVLSNCDDASRIVRWEISAKKKGEVAWAYTVTKPAGYTATADFNFTIPKESMTNISDYTQYFETEARAILISSASEPYERPECFTKVTKAPVVEPDPTYKPPVPSFTLGGQTTTIDTHPTVDVQVKESIRLTAHSTTPNQFITQERFTFRYESGGGSPLTLWFTREPATVDGEWRLFYNNESEFDIEEEKDALLGTTSVTITPKYVRKYQVFLDCTDNTGTDNEEYCLSYLNVTKAPPTTSWETKPNMNWPNLVTRSGLKTNTYAWTYSHITNTPFASSHVKLSKLDASNNPVSVVLDKDLTVRTINIEGEPGELFKLDVYVVDTAGTSSGKISTNVLIDTPYPHCKLVCDDIGYIDCNLNVSSEIDTTNSPFDIYEQFYPSHFTTWETKDLNGNVIDSGVGQIPTQVLLKSSLYEGYKYYRVFQYAENTINKTSMGMDQLYTVPPPSPVITMTSASTYIDEKVTNGAAVTQPPSGEGFPDVPQTFDQSNCTYSIFMPDRIDPLNQSKWQYVNDNGKILKDIPGIYNGYDVYKIKGFKDSTSEDTVYKVVQTARNSWGYTASASADLIVRKTPIPVVYLGSNDTYIDETIPVTRTIEDIFNTDLTKTQIYDSQGVLLRTINPPHWKVEEIDSSNNVIKEIESGTGLANSLDILASKQYEETKKYKLTQYATNKKGAEGYGTTAFNVLVTNPPTVAVLIKERDSDSTTLKDQIYPRESLLIQTTIDWNGSTAKTINWNIKDSSGNVVVSGSGQINGLKLMNLAAGSYSINQYATNIKNKTASGSTIFIVKEVQPPQVDILTNLNKMDQDSNIVYIGDGVDFKGLVIESNRSEEHPNGYTLNNIYTVKDSNGNDVATYRNSGIANTYFPIIKGTFQQGKQYLLRQYSENTEFPEKNALKDIRFTVGNKKPVVTATVINGDEKPPLFTDEEITIKVTITDEDGTIEDARFYVDGKDYWLHQALWLVTSDSTGLKTDTYTATFKYIGKDNINPVFKIVGTDDFGDSSEQQLTLNIIKPTLTADIELKNEASVQKKENRYLEFSLANSTSNAKDLYPIDFAKSRVEYLSEDGHWAVISDSQNYSDEYIRVHYPNWPDKSTISTYFKKKGKYTLYSKVYDTKDNVSEFTQKIITIEEDLAPTAQFTIITPYFRITDQYIEANSGLSSAVKAENTNKAFFIFDDMSISPDGDTLDSKAVEVIYDSNMNDTGDDTPHTISIKENMAGIPPATETVVSTNANADLQVQNLGSFKLTFLSGVNELGNYYFRSKVKEKITQLPADQNNPLYAEIKALEKEAVSDYAKALVDNKAPQITFELEAVKSINLIIHFDHTPTAGEQESIDVIINDLQSSGIKVNLILKYGVY